MDDEKGSEAIQLVHGLYFGAVGAALTLKTNPAAKDALLEVLTACQKMPKERLDAIGDVNFATSTTMEIIDVLVSWRDAVLPTTMPALHDSAAIKLQQELGQACQKIGALESDLRLHRDQVLALQQQFEQFTKGPLPAPVPKPTAPIPPSISTTPLASLGGLAPLRVSPVPSSPHLPATSKPLKDLAGLPGKALKKKELVNSSPEPDDELIDMKATGKDNTPKEKEIKDEPSNMKGGRGAGRKRGKPDSSEGDSDHGRGGKSARTDLLSSPTQPKAGAGPLETKITLSTGRH